MSIRFLFVDISQPFLIITIYRLVLLLISPVKVPHDHFLQVPNFVLDIYFICSQKHAAFQGFEVVVRQ